MLKLTATIALFAALLLAACSPAPAATATPETTSADAEVRRVVEEFGAQLQNVSLLAPDAANQIETYYATWVTPELLAAWQADPMSAPGRQTSSPWPERIEITSIQRIDAGTYQVKAEIVESTSDQPDVHRQAVVITVTSVNGEWLISAFVLGADES